ncbi:DUF1206 domain-containing protein [Sulfitobacter sp. TSTF-M16]|uniref:DUF1206 domain-containing protein n=2 Tax=Sulfitobacter aestuariivivens TaxID=2766981 RepID=A0A927HDI6_9RHOB|nr:DUF1206 domain-containing protein [Sulfitobacter aestuariivivens]
MRAGYGARGLIYTTVGALAFAAALNSNEASGTKDALATLRAQPWGVTALWIIGFGLFAYMIWRIVAGAADVEDHGTDGKGLIARAGQVVTGVLHGIIGVSVLSLAMGGGNAGSGGAAEDWTQKLMSMPAGRYLVAAAALIMLGAGIYYAYKGWSGSYKDHLESSTFTRDAEPVLMGGLIIYGGLLALVAVSLGFAALNSDASQAGGLGQALQSLRDMAFGRFLLGIAGLGLLAFALYNFVEAKYRVIPRISGSDVKTLAKEAVS